MDRLKFVINFNDIRLKKKREFVYQDKFVKAPNHIIENDFLKRKINGSSVEKVELLKQLYKKGYSAERALQFVLPQILDKVKTIQEELYISPINSSAKFLPNSSHLFDIKPHKTGRQLDKDLLVRNIYSALLNSRFVCDAQTQEISPNITTEYYRKATFFRAGFSTSIATSSENRKHNIALSLSKLNGTVVRPNQIFSFNKTVGPRTEKQGYKEGKIIINGRFVDGIGGGVCQVSTTLYNAALRADMCILSVKNHSLPVGYVEPSLDAMVNLGTTDLKFENNTTHPIYIRAFVANNSAVVEFYGLPMIYKIVPESEIVDSIPPTDPDEIVVDNEYKYIPVGTPSGQTMQVSYSKGGLSSKSYLCYYDSIGNLVQRRQIRNDKYKAQRGLIAVAP
ncbi:MAG: VanW family protein [Firmicutes bacterium]|nr:VanW family protein [Bacillota bacterium]MCL1953501.1 VanW family protein [Bacillota bacterium]